MAKQSEIRIQNLVTLGLTPLEAKIYLLVLHAPNITIKDIGKELTVLGPSIHRTLKTLRAKQLISTLGMKPLRVRAISPSVGLRRLIDSRYQEELQKEQELESELKKQKQPQEELRVEFLGNKTDIFSNDLSLIPHLTKEMLICSIGESIPQDVFVAICQAVQRGIVVRVLAETYHTRNQTLLENWQKNGWQVRYLSKPSVGFTFVLYDEKIAVIQIRRVKNPEERMGIVFYNPAFVQAQRSFFIKLWEKGKEIKSE